MPAVAGLLPSKQQEVLCAARGLLGLPFSIGTRDGRATDCGGLAIQVARSAGFFAADLPYRYTRETSAGLSLYVHLRHVCNEIAIEHIAAGDLLLFWIRRPWHPQHLGILTDTGTLIHASPLSDRCVHERKFSEYRTKIFAAFRFREERSLFTHEVPLNPIVKCEACVLADPLRFSKPDRNLFASCKGCLNV